MAWDDGDSAFYSDDNDPTKVLAGIISPAPAHSLVMPPPSTPPRTGPGVTTPQTGSLAYPPQQATPKVSGGLSAQFRQPSGYASGVSNPPNGGFGATISPSVQPVRPTVQPVVQAGMPQPVNPDPQGSLRPGGTTTAMPALPQTGAQQVQGPSQLDTDQSRLKYLTGTGSGISQIKNPVGRVAATAGDIALRLFAPGIEPFIPGTEGHHQMLVGQQQGIVGNDQAQAQAAAQLADTQQKTQLESAKAAGLLPVEVTPEMADVNPALKGLVGQTVSQQTLGGVAKAATTGILRNEGQIDKQDDTDSYQAKNAQSLAEVRQTQEQLNQAKAELAAAGNDVTSPYYKLKLRQAQTAQQNANAATTRATAYMGNYLQGAYNTGLHGDVLPGAPGIGNDQGSRTVVGTRNASTAIKNQANVAQFNDVHGALDSLENSAKTLVQSGGKLNDPVIAAALSQPHGTLGQWIQGQVAKGNMTPQQRDYVIANAAAHENIQAMRKAAGGTATDSSVAKLDALIPGASTPDLDYFLRQTGQIRSTAQRLGQGVTTAQGGSTLRNGAAPVVQQTGQQTGQIPPAAAQQLQEGKVHTFNNGQKWTLQGGKPVRVQ